MKRQKVTEPRNFGGHFGEQGAVAEKNGLQIRIPRSRFIKRKKIQVPQMKHQKVTEPRNFGGHFGRQGAVAEKNGLQIRIPRPRFSKKGYF